MSEPWYGPNRYRHPDGAVCTLSTPYDGTRYLRHPLYPLRECQQDHPDPEQLCTWGHPMGGHVVRRGECSMCGCDAPTVRPQSARDVRGMAEVIRLNCADLDTAEAVLRTYIEREWQDAYDRGREDHRAHDCCGGGAG